MGHLTELEAINL